MKSVEEDVLTPVSGMGIRLQLFIRYFLSVLIPVAVLVVMGVASAIITRYATQKELDRLHDGILLQMEQSVEAFIDELDATGVAISSSSDLLVELRDALNLRSTSYEGVRTIEIIQSVLNPSVYARPALHSVYIFFNDFPGAILTSEFGVTSLQQIPDNTWYSTYQSMSGDHDFLVERRLFKPLQDTEVAAEEVITIYRRIFPISRPSMLGVIVLNIAVDELDFLVSARKTHVGQLFTIHGPTGVLLYGTPPDEPSEFQISTRHTPTNWQYTLYTPREVFLEPSETVFTFSSLIIFLASVAGIAIAIALTKRHVGQVEEVLQVIDDAEAGLPAQEFNDYSRKGFGYVTYRILKTVMEKKYLEVELSEKALRERTLELLFLRSQMNPHFLFNTLEVINWKSLDHTGTPTEINEMITRLSEILKYSLRSPSRFVSLNEEIANARNYLSLQKHRYGERLSDCWSIDTEADTASVIPMLLQPIIENAIYHGIRDHDEQGVIGISTTRRGDRVVIVVSDTGPGMSRETQVELEQRLKDTRIVFTEHVGLVNTYRRLSLAFGSGAQIDFGNSTSTGFSVTVTVPYVPFPAETEFLKADGVRPK